MGYKCNVTAGRDDPPAWCQDCEGSIEDECSLVVTDINTSEDTTFKAPFYRKKNGS